MLGLVFTISYTSIPCSNMMSYLSMYEVSNDTGMSTKPTSLLLYASIADVISTYSNATVGDIVSLFFDPSRCFLLSANAYP